jgi:hypothetical protein
MSGRWQGLSDTLDTLFTGNFPDFFLQGRNRIFSRPTSPRTTGPPRFLYYDYSAEANEVTTRGRTREIRGTLGGLTFVQGSGGDITANFLDRMEIIADAWAETGEASRLYFYGVIPQELVYSGDADKSQWCVREWSLPFLYVSPVSTEGEAILGGISNSTVQVAGPALALLDFVGPDSGAWRRVKAAEGEPSCRGMVSIAPDSNGNALVVLSGFVRIAGGHGFPVGSLYLSQTILGVGGAKPDSGVSRVIAEVLNATDLIVLGSGPEVVE